MNVGSVQLVFALLLLAFGGVFGIDAWTTGIRLGRGATSGTVMVAALPVIVGFQLWLAAIMYDVMKTPRTPIHPLLLGPRRRGAAAQVETYQGEAPSLVPEMEGEPAIEPAVREAMSPQQSSALVDMMLGTQGISPLLPHSPSKTGVNALMAEKVG